MNLEQRQTAMRLKNKKRLDSVAETRVRAAMFLLLASGDDEDLDGVAARFGRTKAWMRKWAEAKYPLLPYF